MPRPRATAGPDSRARLLAAATEEFANHGLAGANVDRIATRARLNKAMVYYHFDSKEALYRETIRATFERVAGRVRSVRDTALTPPEKLSGFIAGFVEEATRHPSFPRMMLRELSETGRHLDADTARTWMGMPDAFFAILREGIEAGVFRHVHPLFALLAVIGPIVLTLASAPARQRAARLVGRALPDIDRADLLAHAHAAAFAVILRDPSMAPSQGVLHASPANAVPDPAPRRVARRLVR